MSGFKLEGIKGLTAADRQLWEKQNIDILKNSKIYNSLDSIGKDDYFKKTLFIEKFKNDPKFEEYKRLPGEKRDSLYNNLNAQPSDTSERRIEQKLKYENPIGSENRRQPIFSELKPEGSTELQEYQKKAFSEIVDMGLTEYQKREQRVFSGLKDRYLNESTSRAKQFDSIAMDQSPAFKRYNGTKYLSSLTDDDKAVMLAQYETKKRLVDEQFAANELDRLIQNTAANNQPYFEKLANGVAGSAMSFSSDLMIIPAFLGAALIATPYDYITGNQNSETGLWGNIVENLSEDKLANYAMDVLETRTLFNTKEFKERGDRKYEIIATKEEQEDPLGNIFNINFIPKLIDNYGFTFASTAASLGSMGLLTGVAKTSTKVASTFMAKQALKKGDDALIAMMKTTEALTNAANKVNPFLVANISASGESAIGGMQSYRDALKDNISTVDAMRNELIEKAYNNITEGMNFNSENGMHSSIINGRMIAEPNEIVQQRFRKQAEQMVEEQYGEQLKNLYNEAETNALNVGGNTLMAYQMINGTLNLTLKAGLQAKPVQKKLLDMKNQMFGKSSTFKQVGDKIVPKTALQSTIKTAKNALKVPVGEGFEEYFQSASTKTSEDIGKNHFQKYIDNQLNPNETLETSFIDSLTETANTFWGTLSDRNVIAEGVFGAISGAVGGVNFNTNLNSNTKGFKDKIPITWNAPFVSEIRQGVREHKEHNEMTSTLNNLFQDPEFISKFKGVSGTMNWFAEMTDAAQNNDEFGYRNKLQAKTINDILTLNKIKDTKLYDDIINDLTSTANVKEGSKEEQLLLNSLKENVSNKIVDQTDAEMITEAKKSAQSMLEMISAVEKESEHIDRIIPSKITDEAKQSIIYGKLAIENWDKRTTQLTEELAKIPIKDDVESTVSEENRAAYVKYGPISKAKAETKINDNKVEIKEIQENLKKLKKDSEISNDVKKEFVKKGEIAIQKLKDENKQLSKLKYTEDLKANGQTEGDQEVQSIIDNQPILSGKDIMALPVSDRAYMLNPDNRDQYSIAQQQVIENLIKESIIKDPDFENKVRDVAKIKEVRDEFLTEYTKSIINPKGLNDYVAKVKKETANYYTKKAFESISQIQDYDVFKTKIQQVLNNGTFQENVLLQDLLKDNEMFNKYVKHHNTTNTIKQQIQSGLFTEQEKNLSPQIEKLFDELDDNNIDYLNTQNGFNYIEQNSEDGQYNGVNVEDITSLYSKVVRVYNENLKELERLNSTAVVQTPETQETVIHPVKNNISKDDKIFNKLEKLKSLHNTVDINDEQNEDALMLKEYDNILNDAMKDPQFLKNEDLPQNESLVDFYLKSKAEGTNTEFVERVDDLLNQYDDKYKETEISKPASEKPTEVKMPTEDSSDFKMDNANTQAKEIAKNIIDNINNSTSNKTTKLSEKDISEIFKEIDNVEDVVNIDDYISLLEGKSIPYRNTNDKRYYVLSRTAAILKQKIQANNKSSFNVNDINIRSVGINALKQNPYLADKYKAIIKFYDTHKIDKFLREHPITPKTKIKFYSDPELNKEIKTQMGSTYSEIDDMSIIAVVEVGKGEGVVINGRNYQPVAILPSSSGGAQGARNMSYFRQFVNSDNVGKIIKNEKGKPITLTSKIAYLGPKTISGGKFGLREVMKNSLDSQEDKDVWAEKITVPHKNKKSLYENAKSQIGKLFDIVVYRDERKSKNNKKLVLNINNGEVQVSVKIKPIKETQNQRGDKQILDILQNGTPNEIFTANNVLRDFSQTLTKIFARNPFDVNLTTDNLNAVSTTLNKELGRYFNISDFRYIVTYARSENDKPIYNLYLKGTTNSGAVSYLLGEVSNGVIDDNVKAQIIKNLILDSNDNVRQHRGEDLVKWDINYENMADFKNNKTYINSVLDDDLLFLNKDNINYVVDNLIFDMSKPLGITKPTTIVTNPDNANTNVSPMTSEQTESQPKTVTIKTPSVPQTSVEIFEDFAYENDMYEVFDDQAVIDNLEKIHTREALSKMSREELEHIKNCM